MNTCVWLLLMSCELRDFRSRKESHYSLFEHLVTIDATLRDTVFSCC
ncbi:hypothetical protein NC651_033981 [Populus alba x Populus x berolinensis]|nr:hypothetical protein NC651_033981 [Populus alba x Populus x berolinensis]